VLLGIRHGLLTAVPAFWIVIPRHKRHNELQRDGRYPVTTSLSLLIFTLTLSSPSPSSYAILTQAKIAEVQVTL